MYRLLPSLRSLSLPDAPAIDPHRWFFVVKGSSEHRMEKSLEVEIFSLVILARIQHALADLKPKGAATVWSCSFSVMVNHRNSLSFSLTPISNC